MPWPKGRPQPEESKAKRRVALALRPDRRKRAILIGGAEHWRCADCREIHPENRFSVDRRATNGLTGYCLDCLRKRDGRSKAKRTKERARQLMDPGVEYRPCPRLPADKYVFGRDGSAWWRRDEGRWRRKKIEVAPKGYAMIRVRAESRKTQGLLLGPLILSAFGRPRPLGFRCHYRNGNRMDVRLDNLEWRRQGSAQKGRIGLRGSRNPRALMSEQDTAEARRMYAYGATIDDVGDHFECDRSTACKAIKGENWGHIPGEVQMRHPVLYGSGNPRAKLDEIDVVEIRQMAKQGMKTGTIAGRMNVAWHTIDKILKGEHWIHVPEDAVLEKEDR